MHVSIHSQCKGESREREREREKEKEIETSERMHCERREQSCMRQKLVKFLLNRAFVKVHVFITRMEYDEIAIFVFL